MTSEQQRGYFKMIGNTTQLTYITDPTFASVSGPCAANGAPTQVCAPRNALPETTLYVPLLFWFCRNPGLALPLIALQYHEVKINLDLRPLGECLWAVNSLTATSGTQSVTTAYQQSLVAASLYVDYIFLDTDERRKMAQNPHEYLIEQVQFTGDESVGSSSNKIKLNFNHPVKELVWVVQPDSNVDYCASLDATSTLFKTLGAQPFNYTDSLDALPNAIHAFAGPAEISGSAEFVTSQGLFQMPVPLMYLDTVFFLSHSMPNLVPPVPLVCLMPDHSSLPRLLLTSTAGVRTLSSPLSFNLTAKTDSLSVKDHTSMLSNLSNTTPVPLTLVSTSTHSPLDLRNTNHLEAVTSPELITLFFNWFFLLLPCLVLPPPRSEYTLLTTTC